MQVDARDEGRLALIFGVSAAALIGMALMGIALSYVGIHVEQNGPNASVRSILLGLALLGANAAAFWFLFERIIRRFGGRAFERTFYALMGAILVAIGQHGGHLQSYGCTLAGLATIAIQSFFPDWTLGVASEKIKQWAFARWPSLQWLERPLHFDDIQTTAAKQKRVAALTALGLAGIAFIFAVGGFWKSWFAIVPASASLLFGAIGLVLAANAVDEPQLARADDELIEIDPEFREVE